MGQFNCDTVRNCRIFCFFVVSENKLEFIDLPEEVQHQFLNAAANGRLSMFYSRTMSVYQNNQVSHLVCQIHMVEYSPSCLSVFPSGFEVPFLFRFIVKVIGVFL